MEQVTVAYNQKYLDRWSDLLNHSKKKKNPELSPQSMNQTSGNTAIL